VVGEGELIESKECPDERGEDEEDINGREKVVLEPKLKIGKRRVSCGQIVGVGIHIIKIPMKLYIL